MLLLLLLLGQADPKADEIRGRIRALAGLEKPDLGLSPTMSGSGFLPIPASRRFLSGRILVDHRLDTSIPLMSLVQAGPDALPYLLESLTDPTPTKLRIATGFDAMWHGHEISGNPFNAAEMVALKDVKPDSGFGGAGESVKEHVVSVGDACFVAVGQISNRPYRAVRYQPTACIVINSPVKDAKLAEEVRAIWGTGDLKAKLLASLKTDFESRGAGAGVYQDGAAMRLLYYFPAEGVPLVVARLKGPDADVGLLSSVSWCEDARIRAELLAIAKRTDDPAVFLAALGGIPPEEDATALERLKGLLAARPPEERGPYGRGFDLLGALLRRFPKEAKPLFQAYLKDASLQRIRSACQALIRAEGEHGELAIEILSPYLKDTRKADGWTYAVEPGRNEPRLPIRVCDEAAQALAIRNPDLLHFSLAGSHALLDRQIEGMLQAIAERPRK